MLSGAEKFIPVHPAEGMMERMIVLHGMVVKPAEYFPRNDHYGIRRDDIVEKAMVEYHGNLNPRSQKGFKFNQIQGRGQKDQLSESCGIPAGINGSHESAVTGSDQDQIRFVPEKVIQFIHPSIERTGKVLQEHVGISAPEKFSFCPAACAFQPMDKNARQNHDGRLCIK
jgi:hypothetical protein